MGTNYAHAYVPYPSGRTGCALCNAPEDSAVHCAPSAEARGELSMVPKCDGCGRWLGDEKHIDVELLLTDALKDVDALIELSPTAPCAVVDFSPLRAKLMRLRTILAAEAMRTKGSI
jgi:hypothetical protein